MDKDKVNIDGKTFALKSHDDLTVALEKQYPQGLTVILENESLANLDRYVWRKVEDWEVLKGLVEDGDARMAKAHGSLEAKLVLPPTQYGLLEACEDTYYRFELGRVGVESEYNATTVMLGFQNSLQGARVQVEISKDMIPQVLPYLYIEDIPFSEVMDMVEEYDIKDEEELMRGLDYRNFASMPGWKQDMVKWWTKDYLLEYYDNNVKPAWREARTMVNVTLDQAAKEHGYASGADYKRDTQWTKNPSPEMVLKFNRITERHTALYEPYRQQEVIELEKYERLKDSMRKQLARNFDRQAKALISDVSVLPRSGGCIAIRCKLDGVQQMGRTILKADELDILNVKDNGEALKEWAAKYYQFEILQSLEHKQSRGMHR
ncbi:MAG: hypothetical protein J6R54_09645 [Bacteroidaceae bacterium]|nr:hypothetical protein [Bacteroidaceae bacterium]